jgi:hypothetical protein
MITALDFEVELFAKLVAGRLRTHPGLWVPDTSPTAADLVLPG